MTPLQPEGLYDLCLPPLDPPLPRCDPVPAKGAAGRCGVVVGDHGADAVERLRADHRPLFATPPSPKNDV